MGYFRNIVGILYLVNNVGDERCDFVDLIVIGLLFKVVYLCYRSNSDLLFLIVERYCIKYWL